jgi:hypothetical protein
MKLQQLQSSLLKNNPEQHIKNKRLSHFKKYPLIIMILMFLVYRYFRTRHYYNKKSTPQGGMLFYQD